jgi:hypothetical protein
VFNEMHFVTMTTVARILILIEPVAAVNVNNVNESGRAGMVAPLLLRVRT